MRHRDRQLVVDDLETAGLLLQHRPARESVGVTFTAHTLTVNRCCGIRRPGYIATIEFHPEDGQVATETESWGAIKSLYR